MACLSVAETIAVVFHRQSTQDLVSDDFSVSAAVRHGTGSQDDVATSMRKYQFHVHEMSTILGAM